MTSKVSVDEMQRIARDEVPYVGGLGVEVLDMGEGTATLRCPVDATSLRPGGTVSGPVMMGLADVAIYAAVLSRLGPVKLAVTTSLNANFLRRPAPEPIIAEARLLKLGKRLAYGEVTITTEGTEDAVCHVTATYALPPEAG